MPVPRHLRQRIERGDLDAVESAWLERLEEAPEHLETLTGVARALVANGHGELARTLLEVLDDELKSLGSSRSRLDLLEQAGDILVDKSRLQERILETAREIWGEHQSFEELVRTVRLDRPQRDLDRIWSRVGRLESLLRFAQGTVVWVEGHGAGEVTEVNHRLESFKVDLEAGNELSVGFRAAAKLLEPLPEDHLLVRKRRQPKRLRELEPAALLEQALTSFDRPLAAAEIRGMLRGLVPEERWSSWWTSAKRHPQVLALDRPRNTYTWAQSTEAAADSLWSQFEKASARKKIELLRRAEAGDEVVHRRMGETLARLGREAVEDDPGLAFEIACALDRAGLEDLGTEELISATSEPGRMAGGIAAKAPKQRAYDLIRRLRSDWQSVFSRALTTEEDPDLLELLAEELRRSDEAALSRIVDRVLAQPGDAPALFTWLAERAADDDQGLRASGLRLFKKILAAMDREELAAFRKRLVALAETGGTLPRLLPHIGQDEAAQALAAVQRCSVLTTDLRAGLESALALRFPALEETEEPFYALASSIAAKREELRTLLEVEIPRNRRAIEEARALGDLRENFEYKSARQRHEYLTSRAEHLGRELGRSRAIEVEGADPSRVSVGTAVRLETEGGEPRVLTILGPWESAPEDGVLSYASDVGRALLGKTLGEDIELEGSRYRVTAITTPDRQRLAGE